MKKLLLMLKIIVVAIHIVIVGFPTSTKAILIDFNDPTSLAALSYTARDGTVVSAARYTFADNYTEDNMTFRSNVAPPDPALVFTPYPHYHLVYEREGALEEAITKRVSDPSFNPVNEPRAIAPHDTDSAIQMTFDPNKDGIPDPFNLTGIDVSSGKLNVGIKFADNSIGVYNDLTQGKWNLLDGTNLLRVTLECPTTFLGCYTVDNILFEPFIPPPVPAPAPPSPLIKVKVGDVPPLSFDPEFSRSLDERGFALVPEPATVLLFGSGIAYMVFFCQRKRI